jgi:hypothetical protein
MSEHEPLSAKMSQLSDEYLLTRERVYRAKISPKTNYVNSRSAFDGAFVESRASIDGITR